LTKRNSRLNEPKGLGPLCVDVIRAGAAIVPKQSASASPLPQHNLSRNPTLRKPNTRREDKPQGETCQLALDSPERGVTSIAVGFAVSIPSVSPAAAPRKGKQSLPERRAIPATRRTDFAALNALEGPIDHVRRLPRAESSLTVSQRPEHNRCPDPRLASRRPNRRLPAASYPAKVEFRRLRKSSRLPQHHYSEQVIRPDHVGTKGVRPGDPGHCRLCPRRAHQVGSCREHPAPPGRITWRHPTQILTIVRTTV
jgi:hypothetical protein